MNANEFISKFKVAVKSLVVNLRRKKPTSATTGRRPILAKPEHVPTDPAEHAVQFAGDWYDRFEAYSRKRLQELGIAQHRIGAFDIDFDFRHAAFFPKERTGGENSPGARINLNSGILNPTLLAGRFGAEVSEIWEKGRLKDRIDAVIVHEDIEGLKVAEGEVFGAAHASALAEAPDTARPIREGARRILRAMRDEPKVRQS